VDEGPERLISMLQTDSEMHAAPAKRSTANRRLVGLAFLDGLSRVALSERLQMPLGMVKSTLRRFLQSLQTRLKEPRNGASDQE
jgi:DNA-directed RNA polymerase specialized sigma24 family protein